MVNYTPSLTVPISDIDKQTNKTASDLVDKSALTLSANLSIDKACDLIDRYDASGASVIDEHNRLLGFISQKECLRYMLDSKYYNDTGGVVSRYMTKDLLTINDTDSLLFMVELFIKNHYQAYPVIDENGLYVGLITRSTLFCELNNLKQTSW